jgi:site-specific DNA-methyltransferase (adenine-specific)
MKRYLDEQEGRPIDTVWTDIPPINSQAKERLGYRLNITSKLIEFVQCPTTAPFG